MKTRIILSCAAFALINGAAFAQNVDVGWSVALPPNTAQTVSDGCQFYADPNATELGTFRLGTKNSAYTGQRYGANLGTFSSTDFLFGTILSKTRPFYNPLDPKQGEARAGGPNDFTTHQGPRRMEVAYQNFDILGCKTTLRQYTLEGQQKPRPFGPTFSFEPGDTLSLNIVNQLPTDAETDHSTYTAKLSDHEMHDLSATNSHGANPIFSSPIGYLPKFDPQIPNAGKVHNLIHDLNHTNIHTHGWHVNPRGNGDNVFVNIEPGGAGANSGECMLGTGPNCYHEQRVQLPPIGPKAAPIDPNEKSHPGGTFWYHAHVHGATAVQVSSGMAGGLIVRDAPGLGLDAAVSSPAFQSSFGKVEDLFLGLQQMPYDDQGKIEGIQFIQEDNKQTAAVCGAGANLANRPRLINGVAVPTIKMDVDQLYRMRFLHSGSIGVINPQILTYADAELDTLSPTNGHGTFDKSGHKNTLFPLYEIETDGLPTGRITAKGQLTLQPAYRSAAMFQIDRTYWQNNGAPTRLYLVDASKAATTAPKQCIRDANGALVLNKKNMPKSVSPKIGSLRYVMAIIEITDSGLQHTSLRDAYTNTSDRVQVPYQGALASYQTQGWNAAQASDPQADFGYAGISPLPYISQKELDASGKAIAGRASANEPTIRVHYYGDGPAGGTIYYKDKTVFRAANTTDYSCPDIGGRCTYCGGSVAEVEASDGKVYNVLTKRSAAKTCAPASTSNAISHGTNADASDAYAAQDRLPWVNFMICEKTVTTKLALDFAPKFNAKNKPVDSVFDESGTKVDKVDTSIFDGAQAKVWSCIKFNETSEMARWVRLNAANQWEVSSKGPNAHHVFHIHVNPFQMTEPSAGKQDALGQTIPANMQIWKDTYGAPPIGKNVAIGPGTLLKTRYTKFSGAFVQHCHILTHEDQGMMQVISVEDSRLVDKLLDITGASDSVALRQSIGAEIGVALSSDARTAGPDLLTLEDLVPAVASR